MNKAISVLAMFATIVSILAIIKVNSIQTMVEPYSMENVIRVRANIPKAQPKHIPLPTNRVSIPKDQVKCLQANIYFESGNQSTIGKIGTGWVTLRRVQDNRFPNTVCDVVMDAKVNSQGFPLKHKCQFSWYCDGLKDVPDLGNKFEKSAWETSGKIAYTMVQSCLMGINEHDCPPDPTRGALFYHSDSVDPKWTYVKTAVVEQHTYYNLGD